MFKSKFYFRSRTLHYPPMDISLVIETIRSNRRFLTLVLDETPQELLTAIPKGFNNNIWWNIAHTLVVQQLLCYKLSGLPLHIDEALVQGYSKGTYPKGFVAPDERQQVRDALLSTAELLGTDYQQGIFKDYMEYTTSARVTLRSIEDGILFNLYHEGLHMGIIRALQRASGNR